MVYSWKSGFKIWTIECYIGGGKADFVVSHLDAPVAVLANTTSQTGNYLAIQLRSTTRQRDAIGTTVTLVSGGDKPRKWVRQLTAGDGYQASNQRQLLIGVGSEQQVNTLEVKWPSGKIDKYSNLPVNRQWMLIESDPSPHLLPGTSPALEQ